MSLRQEYPVCETRDRRINNKLLPSEAVRRLPSQLFVANRKVLRQKLQICLLTSRKLWGNVQGTSLQVVADYITATAVSSGYFSVVTRAWHLCCRMQCERGRMAPFHTRCHSVAVSVSATGSRQSHHSNGHSHMPGSE